MNNKTRNLERNEADEKRINLKKEKLKRNRRLQRAKRRFFTVLFFILAAGILFVLFKAPFFNISEVICVGQEHLTEKDILKTAHVSKGQNIFLTNIGSVKERVKKIPYVSESNARRIFPDKVKIWVRESVPAFAVEKDGKFMICDKNTKVLETVKKNKDEICILTLKETKNVTPGELYADTKTLQGKKLKELIGLLDELDMIKSANNIDFSDISDIIIIYDKRLKIKIGNTNDMEYKLKFIKKIITEKMSEYERATVDYTGDKLYVSQYEDEKPQKDEKEVENTEDKGKDQNALKNEKENGDEQKTT